MMTFRLAVPIALASIGVSISERSGVINLGIEGIMLLGALGGVIGSHAFGSAWAGILVALMTGAAVGILYALCVIRFKANQSVIGIGLNIVASGLSVVIVKFIWRKEGISGIVSQMSTYSIPLLRRIPVFGAFFVDQSPFILLTLVIAVAGSYFLWRTKAGLRLQAIGENPLAAATAGIPVARYRTLAIVVGSCLAALGGAYLSVVHSNLFVNNMVAGRGFIAIAANILGGWNPLGSLLASLLFAFTQALRFQFSAVHIPDQISQMIPYGITLLVLVGVGRRTRAPAKLGILE
jgi:simple sugar transport system permease protein